MALAIPSNVLDLILDLFLLGPSLPNQADITRPEERCYISPLGALCRVGIKFGRFFNQRQVDLVKGSPNW